MSLMSWWSSSYSGACVSAMGGCCASDAHRVGSWPWSCRRLATPIPLLRSDGRGLSGACVSAMGGCCASDAHRVGSWPWSCRRLATPIPLLRSDGRGLGVVDDGEFYLSTKVGQLVSFGNCSVLIIWGWSLSW
ncbi:hypothetical protein PVAP13_9NG748900 [Panicum virgatum]|uniref:Uncharacterized protein n=1 Tax=Panicum virgatum TaxID=38727 RepID=A0A8T0N3S2_PANVG|nr:hypothetical protein PVAP13_9NG748900 [Panicum virgatum]